MRLPRRCGMVKTAVCAGPGCGGSNSHASASECADRLFLIRSLGNFDAYAHGSCRIRHWTRVVGAKVFKFKPFMFRVKPNIRFAFSSDSIGALAEVSRRCAGALSAIVSMVRALLPRVHALHRCGHPNRKPFSKLSLLAGAARRHFGKMRSCSMFYCLLRLQRKDTCHAASTQFFGKTSWKFQVWRARLTHVWEKRADLPDF